MLVATWTGDLFNPGPGEWAPGKAFAILPLALELGTRKNKSSSIRAFTRPLLGYGTPIG